MMLRVCMYIKLLITRLITFFLDGYQSERMQVNIEEPNSSTIQEICIT
jgi:hypothetical protein